MRVLIVSRTPWDNSNSFGNTFTNLFEGMEGVEIYNICCQSGASNNDIVAKAYQMTDASVAKSVIGKRPGKVIANRDTTADIDLLDSSLPHRRITFFYICRDLIWKAGRWKNRALDQFISSVNPDVLYTPVYRSPYMIDVQQYVAKKSKAPIVVHISDDVYSFPADKLKSPIKTIYQSWIRRKLRKQISKASYGEVFAEQMALEYTHLFGIPFYTIGKGISLDEIKPNELWTPSDIYTFVYTGNYGGERGKSLVALAQAIASVSSKARLRIYSTTHAEADIDRQLQESGVVEFAGAVKGKELQVVQQKADCLVHVEGFSRQAICETRLSFSTKIIDYLLAMRPIIAIGPAEINSMQEIINHNLGIVATSSKDIITAVRAVMSSTTHNPYSAISYLNKFRDIRRIQLGIFERLSELVCKR